MPVSSKMKTALRSTLGGKGMDGAPFNAASQGGYRNMSKQIAGGAKMSAKGLANAQQGKSSGVSQTPGFVPEQNQMQAAAGMALQRMSGAAPAATDAMAAKGMGGGVSRSGAAAAQMAGAPQQRYDIANTGMLTAATPMVQAGAQDGVPVAPGAITNAGKLGMVGATPQVPTVDTSGAKYFGGDANIDIDLSKLRESAMQDISNKLAGLDARTAGANLGPDALAGDVTEPAPPTQTTEGMVEQTIRDLLMGGVRDTTAEEQLAREMIQEQQQQALVGQRARAGRAGLVQTGAQAGIESDIRQKAAQQALAEIYGIQAGARGEQRADVGLAGQLYGMDKQLAAEEARTAATLEALKQMYGEQPTAEPGGANLPPDQKRALNQLEYSDLSKLDADSQPGTRGVPYNITDADMEELAAAGIELTETTEKATGTFGNVYKEAHVIYVDQNGNYYIKWAD
jgi:hypothetical protein